MRCRQVEECLGGSRIVIAGDSIMRQFFSSGVSLFRGQAVALDYNKHAHARYRVCTAADKLSFGTFQPKRWEVPLPEIAALYEPLSESQSLPGCSQEKVLEVRHLPFSDDLVPSTARVQVHKTKIVNLLKQSCNGYD